jgi:hypothetical protein
VKGTLAYQVSTNRVAPIQQLPVGAWAAAVCTGNTLKEMDLKRLLTGPRGCEDAASLVQVIQLGFRQNLDELFAFHDVPLFRFH